MLKSIYTPMSGAIAQERVLEVIANNLANLNTHGFKGDKVSFELLEPEPNKHYANPLPPANYKIDFHDLMPLVGNEIDYVGVAEITRDKTQGPVVATNNMTDVMLEDAGFFTVNTDSGKRLTRNGAFNVSPDGVLVTKSGDPVLGARGNIHLMAGEFSINHRGEIYQNGEMVDQLLIQNVGNEKALERVGHNYYFFGGAPEELTVIDNPRILQGHLEGSNVNAIQNLTAMILAHRSVEAYQKAISNYDLIMEKTANRLGEVRA